ncbi:MAG: peptidoglycan DD-metalloendopeptidase family protein [Nitrospirae bacterium]|nr:peptidoglycan DD-metalloendopeptidase family protein [Nitrospirota bacterium]
MKYYLTAIVLALTAILIFTGIKGQKAPEREAIIEPLKKESFHKITGTIKKGETFFNIFKKYGLNIAEFFKIRDAAADVHHLREVKPGQQYIISVNADKSVNSFSYWIDDDSILSIARKDEDFKSSRIDIEYEKRVMHIGGVITDNLISSIGEGRENLLLALRLSDIFAWDIDFTSDLRNADTFKIIAEALYLNGKFKKYGEILSAELINDRKTYRAYIFEGNEKADYFDETGRNLRKAFLKAPLNFRKISSYYSGARLHPILKVYRPHHGLDYSAPEGTPVSAVGDGRIVFAGTKGGYGNLVEIRHPNGYETLYGHLSKINKEVRNGTFVEQGQIIGYVGSTGLATGPHLHYEMRINDMPTNPLAIKMPSGEPVPASLMAKFREYKNMMDIRIASIKIPSFTFAEKISGNSHSDKL